MSMKQVIWVQAINVIIDVRRGEYLSGLLVRAGARVDGIQLLTSLGRKSPMFGNPHGGSA